MARRLDCTAREYFFDPCTVPSLSQSIAHTLITQSPAHAWSIHPRLGNEPRERTKATDEGTLLHRMLLGQGAELVPLDFDNYRTKAAQEARDDAYARGAIPVLRASYEAMGAVLERIRANLKVCGIEFNGESEVAVEWDEDGVMCRGMIDHLKLQEGVIYDVKKTTTAHPARCARTVVDYGYDIQHAAYTSAVEQLEPRLQGKADFLFVFVEMEPPYAVLPARPNGMLRELGQIRWQQAVRLWKECLERDDWPAYTRETVLLEPPPWIMNQLGYASGDL